MVNKKETKGTTTLRHVGKFAWNLGLLFVGIAVFLYIYTWAMNGAYNGSQYNSPNMIEGSYIVAIIGLIAMVIGYICRIPVLLHKSTSKILLGFGIILFVLSFILFDAAFSTYQVDNLQDFQMHLAVASMVFAIIAVLILIIGFIVWCIFRFRQTKFAHEHKFDGKDLHS